MPINIAQQRKYRAEASSATFKSTLIFGLFALGLLQNRQGNALYGALGPSQSVRRTSSDFNEHSTNISSSSSSLNWPGIPAHHLSLLVGAENNQGPPLVRKATPDGSLGPVSNAREYLLEHLDEFLQVYQNRPDKTNSCGIRISHSLAVYTIAKRLQPTTIIESGINSGQSTYFFRKACPDAKIISIDPEPKPICGQPVRWIDDTNNEYLTGDNFIDFDQVNWAERIRNRELDPEKTLVFIDDHRGFFNRFPSFVKYGFRHVINEDNYKAGEGGTHQDRIGLTPKQMFRSPNKPDSNWLYHNARIYAEFPPLVPPKLAENTTHARKVQGGFLHPTDDLEAIEEPLLRPNQSHHDKKVFEKIAKELGLDITLADPQSYQEFMGYCFLCYLELVPLAPKIREAFLK